MDSPHIKALEAEGKVLHIRNDESLAHDNEIVDRVKTRFIFDAITNILRFMKGYEANRFGG